MILTALLYTATASEMIKKLNENKSTKVSLMKNVLVIYEMMPESSHMYLIQADDETVEILKKCHGRYINSNDDTEEISLALNTLSLMLGNRTDYDLEWASQMNIPHELVGMYKDTSVMNEHALEPTEKIDMVVHTGWVM